jgi:tetratricopeptide (TPR) repeat protein
MAYAPTEIPPKVFCCYGEPDHEAVETYAAWLRDNGVDAWLDRWEIAPGDRFIAKKEQALREAELVLVFLSRQTVDCVWQQAEVEAAIVRMVEVGTRVVPVKLHADAPVPALLGSRSATHIEEREAVLASIHARSRTPVLGPPPELWRWATQRAIERQLAAARQRGSLGVQEAAAIEAALGQLLRDRVRWVERSGACLASLAVELADADDLRLPLERLRAPTSTAPMVVRCELSGTETKPEHPSPREEGGRIVLATAAVADDAMLDAVQQACRTGMHHVGLATSPRQQAALDERGAFDPERDRLRSASRPGLVRALAARDGRPGATLLLLACRVRAGGLWLCDAAGAPVPVAAEELAATLEPFAAHLRVVVLLPVADEGAADEASVVLVDAALGLHRRGLAAVAAPRVPLPEAALPELAGTLLRELLGDPVTPPSSLEAALGRVGWGLRGHEGFERLDLRLYARAADGDDSRPLMIVPYRGLASFEPEHARFYMGRTQEIERVVSRLAELEEQREPRLVLLVGASGVGKSSLAKAGVVPRLVGARGGGWVPVLTRPADDEVEPLEARLGAARDGRKLVVVDQLEEIYAEAGTVGAGAYLRRLWSLARDHAGTTVVATLRVDALGVLGEVLVDETRGITLERLASGRHALYVYHLGADELRLVIEVPAKAVGLEVDEGLADHLCQEALAEPGALPMLEVALRHLWSERQGRRLPASAHRDGLAGTLARQANRCIEELPRDQQDHAWRILVRIATGPDVGVATWRRRTTMQALRPERPERRVAFEAALEGLVRGRLVVTGEARAEHPAAGEGHDVPIELAHELLLRRWEALKGRIEQARPTLQAIRELEEWVDEHRLRKTLLTEQQLAYVAQARLAVGGDDLNAAMLQLLEESRSAVRRRKQVRNGLFAGTGVVAIVLAALSYFAVTQSDEAQLQAKRVVRERDYANRQTEVAKQQTRLAEQRLSQAVGLTRGVMFEVLPKLARIPQARAVSKEILERLQRMQQELGATDADVDARWDEGNTHLLRGDEALVTDDLVVARREYQAAFAIATKLIGESTEIGEGHRYLSLALVRLADVEVRAGNLAGARPLLQRSLELLDALTQADPGSAETKRDLAISLDKLGQVESRAGNLASARELLERSLGIREALVEASPESPEAKRYLSIALESLGYLAGTNDDLAGARAPFERSLAIRETLAEADPGNPQAQRDLSIALDRLANLELPVGNLERARSLLERSFAIREALVEADPESVDAQRDLSVSLGDLANMKTRVHDIAGARTLLQRSLTIAEALSAKDPKSALAARDLSGALAKLSELDVRTGNLVGARALLERSLAIRETVAAVDSLDLQARRELAKSARDLGDVELKTGNLARARELLERALAISETLTKADASNGETKHDLSIVLETLGDAEMTAGNLAGAGAHYQRSLALREELATAAPDSASTKRNLCIALERLGDVAARADDLASARELFQRSLAIKQALVTADPSNVEAKYDVSVPLAKLGDVEARAGNAEAARDYLRRSLAITQELATADPSSRVAKEDLAVSLEELGDAEYDAGSFATARDYLGRALALREELVTADPSSTTAQQALGTALERMAVVEAQAGNLDGMRDYLGRALPVVEALVKADPSNAVAKHQLAGTLDRLGYMEGQAGNVAAARDSFARAFAIREALEKDYPDDVPTRVAVLRSLCNLGMVSALAEDVELLRKHATKAKARLDALDSEGELRGDAELESLRIEVQAMLDALADSP